ncbi:MAG: hypothetical protein GF418_02015, partial [Chitinivibrionales bacterium]|nr:hypothetical protein [Chitinivibrionales bacterium]MBD3394376.1 hypothetical protein [Chitinivibrionales bacterium]
MKKRILLVGDTAIFPPGISGTVSERGYEVNTLPRTVDPARVDWQSADVLVAEHSSGFDPFPVCDPARKANPSLPAIFVTA